MLVFLTLFWQHSRNLTYYCAWIILYFVSTSSLHIRSVGSAHSMLIFPSKVIWSAFSMPFFHNRNHCFCEDHCFPSTWTAYTNYSSISVFDHDYEHYFYMHRALALDSAMKLWNLHPTEPILFFFSGILDIILPSSTQGLYWFK